MINELLPALTPKIAAFRRDIHAHPELAFDEKRTSEKVAPISTASASKSIAASPAPGWWPGSRWAAASGRSACAPTWTRCR
jgi:hypothetical protein